MRLRLTIYDSFTFRVLVSMETRYDRVESMRGLYSAWVKEQKSNNMVNIWRSAGLLYGKPMLKKEFTK